MPMGGVKTWVAGVADEPWKILICARDHEVAVRCEATLVDVLTSEPDREKGLELVAAMSGREIVDALKAYRDSALKSVENALAQAH